MAVSLATPCRNCSHPLNVHDNGGDARVLPVCITCSCAAFVPVACYDGHTPYCEHQDPDDDERCLAEYHGRVDDPIRCVEERGHLRPPNVLHRGRSSSVEGMMYTFSDNEAMYPVDRVVQEALDSAAGAKQVGGDHYRKFRIQPWDIWEEYDLDAFTGTVIKYLMRAGHKGSRLEDLKKARHTLDRAIEIEEAKNGT